MPEMLKTRYKSQITIACPASIRIALFLLFAAVAIGPVVFLSIPPTAAATPPKLYTVTKLDDTNDGKCDSDCSLREALTVTGQNDTVSFASGLKGTITLRSTLTISKNSTINGPGNATIVISGNDAVRVFYVDAGVHLTIKSLTVSGGSSKGITGSTQRA